jgi:alkylated DNA repair dioxygenase AlkB
MSRYRLSFALIMNTIELAGGLLHYYPAFLAKVEADDLFAYLRCIQWTQQVGLFGRPMPRLIAWFADQGIDYHYSSAHHIGAGWDACVFALKQKIEETAGTPLNAVLVNYYRTGQDSVGWHADNEKELGANPIIGSLSLGAEREFQLKHKKGAKGRRYSMILAHGSLLVMAGETQTNWVHQLPKTEAPVGERINLTFRRMVS